MAVSFGHCPIGSAAVRTALAEGRASQTDEWRLRFGSPFGEKYANGIASLARVRGTVPGIRKGNLKLT